MLLSGRVLVSELTHSVWKEFVKPLSYTRSKILRLSECVFILAAKEKQLLLKSITIVDRFPDISFQNFQNKYKHRNVVGKILFVVFNGACPINVST